LIKYSIVRVNFYPIQLQAINSHFSLWRQFPKFLYRNKIWVKKNKNIRNSQRTEIFFF